MGDGELFDGFRVSVWKDEKDVERMVVMVEQQVNTLNATEPYT